MKGALIRSLGGVRLVPVVLIAIIALFALKALGLVLDGGYLFDNSSDVRNARDNTAITGTIAGPGSAGSSPAGSPRKDPPPGAKPSWAQEMFNYPEVTGSVRSASNPPRSDITGSAETPSPPKEGAAKEEGAAKKAPQEPPP